MPTTFLSLPREVRDQIYLETLHIDKLTRVGARAEKDIGAWYAGRQYLPGSYRPILHYHKAKTPPGPTNPYYHWSHKTCVASAPAIFQVGNGIGAEARELYLKSHVLFEMKIVDDCDEAVGRWLGSLDEGCLGMIRRVHVYVHVRLFFEGPDSDALTQRLKKAREHDIDLVDPIFRIELRNLGTELVVSTAARIRQQAAWRISGDIQSWAKVKKRPADAFVGADLVTVARRVLEVVNNIKHMHMYLHVDTEPSEIIDVYEHKGKVDDYGTVVRLSSRYPYVVAKLVCGKVDENELPQIEGLGLNVLSDGESEGNELLRAPL
jgi:hypothetical protein